MVRAAFRDTGIVTAVVVTGLGMTTLGSGLAILATLAVATKTQDSLLALAVFLIVLGAVITLAGFVALAYLMWDLVKERRESLALLTDRWSATYSPLAKQLTVDLSFYRSSDSDFRAIQCWVDTGDWQGYLQPGQIGPHWTTKYWYCLTCKREDIEVPKSVVAIDLHVRLSLKDGVEKDAVTKVNLHHVGS